MNQIEPIVSSEAVDRFRIQELRVHELGPFVDFKLRFEPSISTDLAEVHILTGPNGSGKSTIIAALSALFSCWPIGKRLMDGKSRNAFYAVEADIDSGTTVRLGPNSSRSGTIVVHESGVGLHLKDPSSWLSPQVIRMARGDSSDAFAVLTYSPNKILAQGKLTKFDAPDRKSIVQLAASFDRQMDNSPIQWIANTLMKEGLAKADADTQSAMVYRARIDEVASGISHVIGSEFSVRLNYKSTEVTANWDRQELAIENLPDGLKSVLTLFADIAMRLDAIQQTPDRLLKHARFLLLLDEIDVHLHPKWQRKILPALQHTFPCSQIIVSTHSPFVVGSVAEAWIHEMDPSKNESKSSQAGKGHSLVTVINEVFDIEERFDPESEDLLAQFYSKRQHALMQKDMSALQALGQKIAQRGDELDDIVNAELRQLERQLERLAH